MCDGWREEVCVAWTAWRRLLRQPSCKKGHGFARQHTCLYTCLHTGLSTRMPSHMSTQRPLHTAIHLPTHMPMRLYTLHEHSTVAEASVQGWSCGTCAMRPPVQYGGLRNMAACTIRPHVQGEASDGPACKDGDAVHVSHGRSSSKRSSRICAACQVWPCAPVCGRAGARGCGPASSPRL